MCVVEFPTCAKAPGPKNLRCVMCIVIVQARAESKRRKKGKYFLENIVMTAATCWPGRGQQYLGCQKERRERQPHTFRFIPRSSRGHQRSPRNQRQGDIPSQLSLTQINTAISSLSLPCLPAPSSPQVSSPSLPTIIPQPEHFMPEPACFSFHKFNKCFLFSIWKS